MYPRLPPLVLPLAGLRIGSCAGYCCCVRRLEQLLRNPLQLAADLALHGSGDFLEHYQAYLTQLVNGPACVLCKDRAPAMTNPACVGCA